MSTSPQDYNRNEEPLGSWKEIAAYLQRNPATVRRWEKEEGLPVHRHSHNIRSSVYAFPSEIEAWRATRKLTVEPPPPVPLWRRLLTPAFALTMALCLVMVGNGIRPGVVLAEQGQTRSMVCSGPDCDGNISPDGKSLVVQLTNGGIGIHDLARKKFRTVVEAAAGVLYLAPVFSPDGSRIVYERVPSKPQDVKDVVAAVETVVVNANGTGARTVFHGGYAFDWSPDGKRLLIAHLRDPATFEIGLRWLNVADGAIQQLSTNRVNLTGAFAERPVRCLPGEQG